MATKLTYSDIFYEEKYSEISDNYDNDEKHKAIRRNLLKIIEEELTPRQREFIMEYFFNKLKMPKIAEKYGVSSQAVSAAIKRGKKRIERILKYCLKM